VTNNPSPAGSAFSTPPVHGSNANPQSNGGQAAGTGNQPGQLMSSNSSLMNMATMIDTFTDAQLQSNQISSTVLDSPYSYDYQTGSYIDSRNYYGQWPTPHAAMGMQAQVGPGGPGGGGAGGPGGAAVAGVPPLTPTTPTAQPQLGVPPATSVPGGTTTGAGATGPLPPTAPPSATPTQLETSNGYGPGSYQTLVSNPASNLANPVGVTTEVQQQHQQTQQQQTALTGGAIPGGLPAVGGGVAPGDLKSRLVSGEENPDSTTLVNHHHHHHNLTESKLTALTAMQPMTNLAQLTTSHHHPQEGFVKPKPPPSDYTAQYTAQYPNNYQMYPPPPPPPHSAYSAYDAYQNMNYNYGYHQAYSPYGMYPQQTPPPTPPPPSPNWNMYGHHQTGSVNSGYGGASPAAGAGSLIATHGAAAPAGVGIQKPIIPMPGPLHHQQQQVLQQQQQHQQQQQQQQQQAQQVQQQQQEAPQTILPDLSNGQTTSDTVATPTPTGESPSNDVGSGNPAGNQTPTGVASAASTAPPAASPGSTNTSKIEPIGEVAEINENIEAFQDPQMGGVAIALNHGSVLIECAKHEMHATTAVRRPDRHHPTRMTLIFYQHRNLNRCRHGIDEWEEKMRVKKINTDLDNKAKEERERLIKKAAGEDLDDLDEDALMDDPPPVKKESSANGQQLKNGASGSKKKKSSDSKKSQNASEQSKNEKVALHAPTLTTTSWTTLFPMHPCVVSGKYPEGNSSPTSSTNNAPNGGGCPAQQQQQQPPPPPGSGLSHTHPPPGTPTGAGAAPPPIPQQQQQPLPQQQQT